MMKTILKFPLMCEFYRRSLGHRFTEEENKTYHEEAVENLRSYKFDDDENNSQKQMNTLVHDIETADKAFKEKLQTIHEQT